MRLPRSKRICGGCGKSGHFKKVCPDAERTPVDTALDIVIGNLGIDSGDHGDTALGDPTELIEDEEELDE